MRLLVEADGGARGNPGPAAYGSVVRDADSGEVLAELADYLGETTNNVAEYSGLVAGLRAAYALDPQARIEVRMDSKLVVEQMSGRWKIKHEDMRRLALAARDAFPPEQVTYTWVPRRSNGAADALVNECLDAVARGAGGRIERRPDGPAAPLDPPSEVPTTVRTTPVPAQAVPAPAPRPAVVGWGPDLGEPVVLTALRHGVTVATSARVFSGAGGADPPLTEVGLAQAAAAASEVVARGGADVLVCSPLLRTRQTAQVVADRTGLVPVVVDDLRECAFGEWEGLTFAEVLARWPDHMARWLADPDVAPPGGESLREVYERVSVAVDQVREEHPGRRVLAVSHVGSIRALVARVVQAPLLSMNRMELQPASLTTVTWYADGNASLRGYGEATHLRGL